MKTTAQIFACLIISLAAYTQSLSRYNSFTLKKLSQADGLSQGSNYFLHEDAQGFMWITANDAVNRYDGSWVKVYKEKQYFKDCPVLKQGYGFAEDNKSNIYVGSTVGLYKYNRNHDDFTLIKIFKDYADDNCIPFAFYKNKIWCYNRFYAIAAVDVSNGKISFYKDVKTDTLESFHAYMFSKTLYRYRAPFFDKHGMLWVTTRHNIIAYNLSNNKATYYLAKEIKKKNLFFYSICYDSSKNIIAAGTNKGLYIFKTETHTENLITKIQGYDLSAIECIKKINQDFVYSTQNSVAMISNDFKEVLKFDKINNQHTDLSYSTIACVDRHKRLWVCKSGYGLSIFDFNDPVLVKETGSKEEPEIFSKNGVHSFAEYPNGDILIRSGTRLFIKSNSTKEISEFSNYKNNGISLPLKNDYSRNGIWFFYGNKVALLDCKTNKPVITIAYDESKLGGAQDIAVLPSNDVWLAFSTGVYSIDFIHKKLVAVENLQIPNAFKINLVNKNHVAISYLNNDMLYVLVNSAVNATVIRKILTGIKSFYLQWSSFLNKFWVGSDDGLYLLDANLMEEKKLDATYNLSGSYIYGLLLDDEHNVWISHEKGLSCISFEYFVNGYYFTDFKITNYDEDDNIQDRDYNNRSFFKSKDGTLYFGGIKGYNSFKPPVTITAFYKPELYIDEIEVNNKPLFADTNYTTAKTLNLSPRQNLINIHAVIKDLDIIGSNQIIYRFSNIDTPWRYLPANSNIIFNNLAPGDYTLELDYYNTKQQQEVFQKTISIHISSPFYKTILFWILISVAVTALVVWQFNQSRLKKQKRLFAQQTALMKERNRITSDLHDDVGASLSSLQIHSVIARQIIDADADKAKFYLDKVIKQSSDINSNISDIIWSMKSQEDRLVDLDGRIRNTISSLLGATNIIYAIEIETGLDNIITNITARKNIMLIIKEATNNCAKYSGASSYKLLVCINDNVLQIIISDNGKGINASKIKTGNGLQNMKRRVEELGGTLKIESAENKGTMLQFNIPATEIRG